MSAFYLRPVVTYPARCSAPAFFARPPVAAFPSMQDFAPLFSLFDESIAQVQRAQRQARPHFKRPFNPRFDVKETNQAYSLEGELPGFDAENISIEFLDDGHTLQIKGKTVKETRNEQPKAVQSATPVAPEAVEQAPAEKSETSSVKSHQATVEDEVEEPANASAVTQQTETQPQEQTVAEPSKAAEQQTQTAQEPQADTRHLISERYTGSFTRSFKFPSKVDQEAVRASLKDGILAITLPFARKPESRRIQIE